MLCGGLKIAGAGAAGEGVGAAGAAGRAGIVGGRIGAGLSSGGVKGPSSVALTSSSANLKPA